MEVFSHRRYQKVKQVLVEIHTVGLYRNMVLLIYWGREGQGNVKIKTLESNQVIILDGYVSEKGENFVKVAIIL